MDKTRGTYTVWVKVPRKGLVEVGTFSTYEEARKAYLTAGLSGVPASHITLN